MMSSVIVASIIAFGVGLGIATIFHTGIIGLRNREITRLAEDKATLLAKLRAAEAKIASQLNALGKKL